MSVSSSPHCPPTIFSTLPGRFPEVHNQKIKTKELLDASMGVVILVENFGKVFSPVVNDMNGNIRKISCKYETDVDGHEFVEDMILKQNSEGDLIAVDALQWLRRGLHFISRFFQCVIEDSDNNNNTHDLSVFVKTAYRDTLKRYHGWLGSQLFNILSKFVPNRQQFFYQLALGQHDREQQVLNALRKYTVEMEACVQKLEDFYREYDLESSDRV